MALNCLVDTNVFLEVLLGQGNKERWKKFLQDNAGLCGLSDFSLHSIGVIAFRGRRESAYHSFLQDALPDLALLHLEKTQYGVLLEARQRFDLDFDDAYQFVLAKSRQLTLVTQDRHFDRVKNEVAVELL